MTAEIAQLELDLEERQKRELDEYRKKVTTEGEATCSSADGDGGIGQGVADLSLVSDETGAAKEGEQQQGKKTRAQKRKVHNLIHIVMLVS